MQQANMQNPDAHQVKMMAELAGLDDQIGADDWTISKSEITGRKLIKRTPRYNVYKADWFGDVIVYEPIVRPAQYGPGRYRRPARRRGSTSSGSSSSSSGSTSSLLAETALDEADIRARLNLCLGLGETPPSSPRLGIMIDSESDADSAYSSYSSTPTRHTLKQQFEFPTQQSGIGAQAATAAAFVEQQEEQEMERHAEQSVGVVLDASRSLRKSSPTSPPVVLNRDSFPFGAPDSNRDDYSDTDNEHDEEEEEARLLAQGPHAIRRAESNYEHESVCSSNSSISTETESTIVNNTTTTTTISAGWFELNELRLVAHENFMLFMGASIEESAINMSEQLEQTASLVMQMSHPKSVSLYDLLHANNTTTTTSANYLSSTPSPVQQSPTKRFFTQLTSNQQHNFKRWQPPQQQQRRQLTIETKLNICQQVTDAMTYLHDKNIVHGRLTSANVYIEPNQRVKISLIDTDERQIAVATATTEVVADQPFEAGSLSNSEAATNTKSLENFSSGKQTCSAAANFNLSTLTYLSPELIRTIRLTGAGPRSGVQMDTSLLTKEADVFSFGTLLFELFEERFPFSDTTKSSGQPAPSSSAGPSAFRSSATELAASGGGCLPSPGTTKLFHSLCLDTPPLTPRFNYSFAMQQQQQQQHYHHSIGHAYKLHLQTSTLTGNEQQQQQQTAHTTKTFSNGNNIRTSASELIYQIGSGQIAHRNNIVKTGIQRCPALVEQSIARCWSCEPSMRPSFKQLRFE